MKEKFLQLPVPLRKQILLRLAGTAISLAMLLLILIYGGTWQFWLPCALAAVLCLGSAAFLFDQCVSGKYICIHAVCTDMDRTTIRHRIKALYLQSEKYRIRLVGIRPIRNLKVGDSVELFISENTEVYEADRYKVICSYITLARSALPLDSEKKEIQIQ